MSFIEILLVSITLAVDASVCSVIFGDKPMAEGQKIRQALMMASTFGIFQFIMPLIGFFGGGEVVKFIDSYDHWVAFALLLAVSLNMFKEAFSKEEEKEFCCLSLWTLLSLGVATSIDALAVGFSIGLIDTRIIFISAVIGIVCFMMSFGFFMAGNYLSRFKKLNRWLNLAGAATLFCIGLGVLFGHGVL